MRITAPARWVVLAATILTAGSGCDKEGTARAVAAETARGVRHRADRVDLAHRPPVLYQLFGERHAPRMLPIAILDEGRIEPIALSDSGWRQFDLLYHRPGAVYTIYQDGRPTGTATVTQPMWGTDSTPLYRLPGCSSATPLAAVRVQAPLPAGYLVEHLATDAPIAERPRRPLTGSYQKEARRVAAAVAAELGILDSDLDRLELRSVAVATDTSDSPTLVVTFMDPAGTLPGGGRTRGSARHLFILADRGRTDRGAGGYAPTYTRAVMSDAADSTAEYRRYVDHLDLTGDGVDEIILEGWTTGHESHILVLSRRGGVWEEVFRGRERWCVG